MTKVIVAGSINMDIINRVKDLPLPGETISGRSVEYLPGGKGLNQAVASAEMDAETILVSRLGEDAFAPILLNFLKQRRINIDYIKKSPKESGTAFITVADNAQNTIIVVPGSNADISPDDIKDVPINRNDIIISQFEIPLPTVAALFKRAKNIGAKTILNPSPIQNIPADLLENVDILIVNETELGVINGMHLTADTSIDEITAIAQKIKSRPSQIIIVTLGKIGALVIEDSACLIEGCPVEAIDTVGAGDCFAGVLASRLLHNQPIKDCAQSANKAASICVTRKGAAPAMPHFKELFPD